MTMTKYFIFILGPKTISLYKKYINLQPSTENRCPRGNTHNYGEIRRRQDINAMTTSCNIIFDCIFYYHLKRYILWRFSLPTFFLPNYIF